MWGGTAPKDVASIECALMCLKSMGANVSCAAVLRCVVSITPPLSAALHQLGCAIISLRF